MVWLYCGVVRAMRGRKWPLSRRLFAIRSLLQNSGLLSIDNDDLWQGFLDGSALFRTDDELTGRYSGPEVLGDIAADLRESPFRANLRVADHPYSRL